VLPNLIVIGGMKCGTSSLHYYLSLHPEIAMSERKELDFFVAEKNWKRGIDWYSSQFAVDTPIRGESSPNYTKFPTFAGVPERISSLLPQAKLIYLVRDPIERILSHYIHNYSAGRANDTIARVLEGPDGPHYLDCSRYFMQLEQYLRHYPSPSMLVVSTEELREGPREALETIFRFLGVDDSFHPAEFASKRNESRTFTRSTRAGYALSRLSSRVGSSRVRPFIPRALARPVKAFSERSAAAIERPVMDNALRQRLAAALRDDVERLREFTGKGFESWPL
jgi:Sulfotransferase domain